MNKYHVKRRLYIAYSNFIGTKSCFKSCFKSKNNIVA